MILIDKEIEKSVPPAILDVYKKECEWAKSYPSHVTPILLCEQSARTKPQADFIRQINELSPNRITPESIRQYLKNYSPEKIEKHQRRKKFYETIIQNAQKMRPVWKEIRKREIKWQKLFSDFNINESVDPCLLCCILIFNALHYPPPLDFAPLKERRKVSDAVRKHLTALIEIQKKYGVFSNDIRYYLTAYEKGQAGHHLICQPGWPDFNEFLETVLRCYEQTEDSNPDAGYMKRRSGDAKKDEAIIFIKALGKSFTITYGERLYGTIRTIAKVFLNVDFQPQEVRERLRQLPKKSLLNPPL